MIRITRKHAFMDLFRAYKVLLDGKEVSRIRNGKQIEVDVSPGIHLMQLKIDWCYSNEVEFELKNNQDLLEFECGNNYAGKRVFRGVLNTMGSGGHYLWLKEKSNDMPPSHDHPANGS